MNRLFLFFAAIPVLAALSCAAMPSQRVQPVETTTENQRIIPEIPEKASTVPPEQIMGIGQIPREKLSGFLLRNNPWADPDFVENLTFHYMEEAALEGVNYDAAFAQMCLETGYLSFGGDVSPDQNNFCGLGAIGGGNPGNIFPDPQTGVRAHIQHLKAYATEEPLNQEIVDPRYRFVRLGSAPTIYGLAGTWAADLSYGSKLSVMLQRMYNFSFAAE